MKKFSLKLYILMAVLVILSVSSFGVIAAEDTQKSNLELYNATTLGATPCLGEAKMLVFYTTFPGGSQLSQKTVEEVEDEFFSEEYKNETEYGKAYSENDSVRSFYYRSSYGKLDMTGDVFEYTMKNHESTYKYYGQIADEIIAEFEDDINWSDYDANNDGYIDAFCVVAKTRCAAMTSSFVTGYSKEVGGKKIAQAMYTWGTYFSTILHETCHMFGPADMYAGVSLNPAGIATECIMDGGAGDLPGATKYVLGWTDTQFVSGEGSFEIEIDSYSTTGSMAVIYPNGDPSNENWFVVEYLTKESNDVHQGVRIWKTSMYLDELHNIKGSDEFCGAMPPSPYEYLEAIHPDGEENYYFSAGESITPYTYPSTAYGATFLRDGGLKYLDDLTYSGVSISVAETDEEKAKLNIVIDNTPDTGKKVTARLNSIGTEFINDSTRVHFAQIETTGEVKVTEDVYISDGKVSIPIIAERVKGSKNVNLYITSENAKLITSGIKYNTNLASCIKSYYDSEVVFENFDGTLTFSSFVIPLQETKSYTNGVWAHSGIFEIYETFFTSADTTATIYYDTVYKYVALIENDLTTNTYTRTILEENILDYFEETDAMTLNKVWFADGKHYIVVLSSSDKSYVLLYDKEGTLLDDYCFETKVTVLGNGSLRLIVENMILYEIIISDNTIVLSSGTEHTNNVNKIIPNMGGVYNTSVDFLTTGIYTKNTYSGITLSNGDKTVVYERKHPNSADFCALYHNDVIYLAEVGNEDIIIYEYNKDLELLEQYTVLEDIPFKSNLTSEFVFITTDEGFALSFNAVAKTNVVNYGTEYLLLFDKDFNLEYYYRYGDSSYAFPAMPVYMGGNKFLFACSNKYFFVSDTHIHDYEEKVTKTATCAEEGIKEFTCSCGDVYTESIPKSSHYFWSYVTSPTCTSEGFTTYTCSNCSYSYIAEKTNALGHYYYERTIKTATCAEEGIKEFYCSCGDAYTEAIPKINHNFWYFVTSPTCTSGGFTTYSCVNCSHYYIAEETQALGHNYDSNGICHNCGDAAHGNNNNDDNSDGCSHFCHKNNFIWKIIRFIIKLFRVNQYCSCGAEHYRY